jgi:hypothetical protein
MQKVIITALAAVFMIFFIGCSCGSGDDEIELKFLGMPKTVVTGSDVTVMWETTINATSEVVISKEHGFDYLKEKTRYPLTGDETADSKSHSVTINDLDYETYYYVVISKNINKDMIVSNEQSFSVNKTINYIDNFNDTSNWIHDLGYSIPYTSNGILHIPDSSATGTRIHTNYKFKSIGTYIWRLKTDGRPRIRLVSADSHIITGDDGPDADDAVDDGVNLDIYSDGQEDRYEIEIKINGTSGWKRTTKINQKPVDYNDYKLTIHTDRTIDFFVNDNHVIKSNTSLQSTEYYRMYIGTTHGSTFINSIEFYW